jgi:5'-nucleotidase (lipoprotein e(P4) family)
MKNNLFLYVAVSAMMYACSSGKKTISAPLNTTPAMSTGAALNGASVGAGGQASLMTDGPLWGSVFQQKAAEYEALCFQAYNAARWRLDAVLSGSGSATGGTNAGAAGGNGANPTPAPGLPLAIVTDIDETLLDNSPYAVHQALAGQTYNDSSWISWTAKVACDTVPGALTFLKYAASKGIDIYYITNRLEVERTPTLQNLQKWGFPQADNQHLILRAAGSPSSKETRRQAVAQTHHIIMLLGDNLTDFASLWDRQPVAERRAQVQSNASLFGSTFIVLPNPVYGDWEGAMYHFHYPKTSAERAAILVDSLKSY